MFNSDIFFNGQYIAMIKLKETSEGDQKISQEIKQFIIKADEGEDYHFYHYGSEIPIEVHVIPLRMPIGNDFMTLFGKNTPNFSSIWVISDYPTYYHAILESLVNHLRSWAEYQP